MYATTREEELRPVPWTPEQVEDFLRMQFEAQHGDYRRNYPDAAYEIILVDDTEAGRLYVRRDERAVHVIDIALLPEFRGRGIGTTLLEELIDEAAGQGQVVSAYVEHTNRALALYERLGFTSVADQGVYLLVERRPPDQAKTA